MFPAVGLVQGLGGRGHAGGQATRAEASTSGVCLRPSKTRAGPGAERGPTRERGGRPASPRSSGARTRGAVGVGQVGEPRISAQTGKGPRRRPAWTPLGGGLWRGAAEEKRKQFGNSAIRPPRIEEARRDCPAPPDPHLHGRDRRVSVGPSRKLNTITASRTDVLLPLDRDHGSSGGDRASGRKERSHARRALPGRAPSGGQVDQSRAGVRGAGHQSQSNGGNGAGPPTRPGGRRPTPSGREQLREDLGVAGGFLAAVFVVGLGK